MGQGTGSERSEAPASRRRTRLLWRLDVGVGLLIVALAFGAFFHLSREVPHAYFWDNVSVGLNAFCLLATGADEYGARWPLIGFRSLDDYKGSLNLYVVAAAYFFTGPSLYVARILSMALTFLATLMLVVGLRHARGTSGPASALVDASFFSLFVLSPWLLVPERVFVEDGILYATMALVVLSTKALLEDQQSVWRGVTNGIAVGLLSHCYSPGKVLFLVHPVLLAAILASEAPRGLRRLVRARGFASSLAATALIGLPHLLDALGEGRGLSRYRTVGHGNGWAHFVDALFANLSLDFLFLTGDENRRHHFGYGGMLNLFFLPILVIGLGVLLTRARRDAFCRYTLLLFPLCFLPATIAADAPPHALRTLPATVPILVVSYFGLRALAGWSFSPLRPTAVAALFLWAGFGAYRAAEGLRLFWGPYSQSVVWGYSGPKPSWGARGEGPPRSNHYTGTLGERYWRATELGELEYCAAYDPSMGP